MSAKNEHLLEEIASLKKENEILKKNLELKSYIADKHIALKYCMEKVLRKEGLLHLIKRAQKEDSYKPYDIDYLRKQESLGKGKPVDRDQRSCDNHNARQRALRELEGE